MPDKNCKYPDICAASGQCEHWLRFHQGCSVTNPEQDPHASKNARTFEVDGTELIDRRRVPVTLILAEDADQYLRLIGSSSKPQFPDFGLPGKNLMLAPQIIDTFYMTPLFKDGREALQRVLDYNWDDELKDFRDNPFEHHVFRDLVMLHNLLTGSKLTPEDHLKPLDE